MAKYSSGVSGGLPNFFRDSFFRWSASRSYIVVEVVYPLPSGEEEEDDIDAAESLGLENNDDDDDDDNADRDDKCVVWNSTNFISSHERSDPMPYSSPPLCPPSDEKTGTPSGST